MARPTVFLALALSLCARTLLSQGVLPVVSADTSSYVSQTQAAAFRQRLLDAVPSPGTTAAWEEIGGAGRGTSVLSTFDSSLVRDRIARDADALRDHVIRRLGGRFLSGDSTQTAHRSLLGLSPNTVDVTFDGSLQFQLSTTRQRNLSCTPAQVNDPSAGCGGTFKTPTIDNTVQLVSEGIFDQRFHIHIDFDSKRDYGANNIVSAWYEGLPDEKLQSIYIGSVQWTPPASRFFTASVPTSNFGISAAAQFGPVKVQGIIATQKGSVVVPKTFTIGNGVVAPQDNTTRDLDYEADRFFWVVDPTAVPGYPAVDILNASQISMPAAAKPAEVLVYRYVAANQLAGASSNFEGITATASNGVERTGAVRWLLLKPNVDYWIDPSGLWFVLKSKINPSDFLAVSYRTVANTMVGSLPATDAPENKDSLRLIYQPNQAPSSPLFPYEMRQVYRVAGSSLVRSSLQVQILVAGSERPDATSGTFLSLLGLSTAAQQNTFDTDNRLFPRVRDAGASTVIQDYLIVFPNAQPFGDPRLPVAEQNDSIYVTPEYLLLSQGPPSKFQLHLQFDAQSGADRSSITLEALQIAVGSEHLVLNNNQTLVRTKDYTIDYTTGRVTFLDPVDLFGTGTATITATFEQQGLFAVAPTSLAGLSATWTLGVNKSISVAGVYQAEATGYTRPPIGYEPQASMRVGLTGDFLWNAPALTKLVNHFATKKTTAPSSIHLSGELAASRPDPNRSGDATVADFENDNSILLQANETNWVPGSMPKSSAGLTDILSAQGFDSAGAVRFIWQNLVPNGHDSISQLSPHDIDPTVALTQSSSPTIEPVLYISLHADTAGGILPDTSNNARWTQPMRHLARFGSMTTAISPTGTDLTPNAYLEFALYQAAARTIQTSGTRLVVDIGSVSEDALAIAPDSFLVLTAADVAAKYHQFKVGDTVYTGRQYVGVGTLQTEKSFVGTWNALTDDNGILGDRPDSLLGRLGFPTLYHPALCVDIIGSTTRLFQWGDLGARCSNHDGFANTEDLDGDNVLDAQGSADNVFRYIINLSTADSAKYFERSHTIFVGDSLTKADSARSATWTIYHIPLRGGPGITVDTIGTPDMHLIKHVRITAVAPADPVGPGQVVFFALALMKFTGAAWVSRAAEPIVGLSGPTGTFHGAVTVSTVSTQDGDSKGDGYQSPPGIGDASSTIAVSTSQLSQQINEKSLSIQVNDLHPGERAEAYMRLVAGSQNLLNYGKLRVWVRGADRIGVSPAPGWNNGVLRAYVKVGSDAYNFYMYRAPATTTTWDPEMVIDLQTWKDLHEQVEQERLNLMPPGASDWKRCNGDSTSYVACSTDLSYMVQVHDPLVNPPNLAAVQELAAGIYYPDVIGSSITTELWVDDIRVSDPVSKVGVVGALTAHVSLADIGTFDLSGVYQNGNYQQSMGALPTYQNTTTLTTATTVRLDRFLPQRLGLLIPVSFTANYGWTDPQLLAGSDVEAAGIAGLRLPHNDATTWTINIVHPGRTTSDLLTRLVLNPFSLNASGSALSTTTSLSDGTSTTWSTTLNYFLSPQRHTYSLHLKRFANSLPRWLRESDAGRAIAGGAITPWPTSLQFSSNLSHTMGDLQTYQVPIMTLADTILKPVTSEQYLWHNSAGLTLIPVSMLTLSSNWASTRDLQVYADSTSIARVANAAHESLLGTDIGVERDRNLTSTISLAPHLASWLLPSVSVGSNFILSRSLTSRNPVRIDGDTAGAYILPQTFNNSRVTTYLLNIDPHKLVQRLFGDSSGVAKSLINFRPIDFSRTLTLQSTFDLARFDPGLGYQLALGSFDSFLYRNGEHAIGAANATTNSASASVDLHGGFSASTTFSSTSLDQYQQNSTATAFLQTTGTTETWPAGRLSWGRTFTKGPVLQASASSSLQHDHAVSSSPLGDTTTSVATSETNRFTPDFLITFRNLMSLHVTGELDRSNALYSGNVTQTVSSNLIGTIGWQTRMPRFLSATRRTIIANLTLTQNTSSSCIQQSSDSTCKPYYDLRRTEVNTNFRALLERGITAGLQFDYVHNDVQSLGQLSSTIIISATFTVPLSSLGM